MTTCGSSWILLPATTMVFGGEMPSIFPSIVVAVVTVGPGCGAGDADVGDT
jgi:hypothetical protein